jgi:hypothetical protein
MQVNLSRLSGALPAVAVDTRKAYFEIELGDLPAGPHTIKLPAKSDWVVAVGRFQASAQRGEHRSQNTARLSVP